MTIIKPGTNLDKAARILRDVVQIFVDDPTCAADTEKVLSLKKEFDAIATKCDYKSWTHWPLGPSKDRIFRIAIEYGEALAYDGKSKCALRLRTQLAMRSFLNAWDDFVNDCDFYLYSIRSADEHSKTAK